MSINPHPTEVSEYWPERKRNSGDLPGVNPLKSLAHLSDLGGKMFLAAKGTKRVIKKYKKLSAF